MLVFASLSIGGGAVAHAADPSIVSLALVNADTGQPIPGHAPLSDGASLDLGQLPTRLSVEAFTSPATVGSVVFELDGTRLPIENYAPYALFGGTAQVYNAWSPSVGSHTLKVTAYTGRAGQGTPGTPSTYTFTVKQPWPSTWAPAASASAPRLEPVAAVQGGKLYAFGGFTDSSFRVTRSYVRYEVATNRWQSLGTLPAGMAETHQGVAGDGRYVYFAGGFGGNLLRSRKPTQWISDAVWRYDPLENSWLQIARLPEPRGAGGLALVGRTLHYVGGNPADRITDLPDHFTYDLDTQRWGTAAPLPDPRDHFSTIVLGGLIYVIGGQHRHDELHLQRSTVHAYNPVTNAWRQLASLPLAKSHAEASTFVSDGKIVMAGGQVANSQPTAQVASYDPVLDSWTTPSPGLPFPRQGAVTARIGTRIVLTLGAVRTDQPQAGTWIGQLPLGPVVTAPRRAGSG